MRFTGIPFWAVMAAIGAAVGVLALLHLLRVRPRELRVVTTLFWVHAVERSRARVLLERFRHPLTYALLLAICALIALALGRPEREAASADRAHVVVIVDAGSGMAARGDGGGTRLDLARQRAMVEVDSLSSADAAAILAVDPSPRLIHRLEDPRPLIPQALSAIAPAATPSARDRAVRLARSLLEGRSRPRIVLITDRAFEPAPGSADAGAAELRVVQVGTPLGNAAIISAMFLPDETNPLRGRFLARVAAFGPGVEAVNLLVQRAGGAPLLNESASIAPGTTRDFVLADLAADGDRLVVRLSSADALAADDEAAFHLPLRNPIRIAARGAIPAGLRIGLESDPAVRFVDQGQAADIEVRRDGSGTPAPRPCIVIENAAPLPPDARISVAADHPFLRGLDFEGAADVLPARRSRAAVEGGLIASGNAVLAQLSSEGGVPRLVLGETLWSDETPLHRRAAFAVFLARAVRDLAGWDADPVVLAPHRLADDPLWAERAGLAGDRLVMPADRASADLASAMTGEAQAAPRDAGFRPALEPFEILLAAALLLLVVEAFLHLRGRIS